MKVKREQYLTAVGLGYYKEPRTDNLIDSSKTNVLIIGRGISSKK